MEITHLHTPLPPAGLCRLAALIPGLPSPSAAMLALQGRVLPAQPAQRETDFYVIPRPVFLFRTCCCFRRGSPGLTQLLPVLLYPGQRPRTIMHPRLLSFPRTYLLYHDARGLWRIPVCVFIHSHCDHSIFKKKKKKPIWARVFAGKLDEEGKTLAQK